MKNEKPLTVRRQIIQCLELSEMTIRDISQMIRISEKDVLDHLPFIEKSIRNNRKIMKKTPCRCLYCGFEFKSRKRFSKPGKCPQCRGTRIEPAVYTILSQ